MFPVRKSEPFQPGESDEEDGNGLRGRVMLGLMLATTACSGTVQDRQASADQVFGDAKMGLVVASGLVF